MGRDRQEQHRMEFMTGIRERIEALLSEMNRGAMEREEVIALSLLAALSGESIFLLGLPGVGKSMVARRLKTAFADSRGFEYLMSRFSTPDEIFGPVSISKLKDEDTYERVTSGYMPEADIVFLDEIWKAGPAIQNSLLTAINEKIFRNGDHDIRLPLKGLIAASNELPAEGEGLEALWDRFLIRYIVEPIEDKGNFLRLISGDSSEEPDIPDSLKFTGQDYDLIRRGIRSVAIPKQVSEVLFSLRSRYRNLAKKAEEEDRSDVRKDEEQDDRIPYVSDRRWKKIAWLLKASAFLNGRDTVNLTDCLLLEHMIWDHDSELEKVRKDVADIVSKQLIKYRYASLPEDSPASGEPGYFSPDGGEHYVIEMPDSTALITAVDYRRLGREPVGAKFVEGDVITITGDGGDFTVRCSRPGCITINSYIYPLKRDGRASVTRKLESQGNDISAGYESFRHDVSTNLFLRDASSYTMIESILERYASRKNR